MHFISETASLITLTLVLNLTKTATLMLDGSGS